MDLLGGFSQKRLNEIWDSLSSDKPQLSVRKVTDDDREQAMTFNNGTEQVSVSRRLGGEWFDIPSGKISDFI